MLCQRGAAGLGWWEGTMGQPLALPEPRPSPAGPAASAGTGTSARDPPHLKGPAGARELLLSLLPEPDGTYWNQTALAQTRCAWRDSEPPLGSPREALAPGRAQQRLPLLPPSKSRCSPRAALMLLRIPPALLAPLLQPKSLLELLPSRAKLPVCNRRCLLLSLSPAASTAGLALPLLQPKLCHSKCQPPPSPDVLHYFCEQVL